MKADRECVAQALDSLGYQIDRTWKFRLRDDERTPSAFINKDGYIHDYGSGFHGDLAEVLKEYHHFSLAEAFKKARELLNMPVEIDFSQHIKKEDFKKDKPMNEKYLVCFAENRKTHFDEYSKLLKGLLVSVGSKKRRMEIALKYEIGYSKAYEKNGKTFPPRLIMPIRNELGEIVTLWKYNPFLEPKEKLRYTRGRKRCAFNIKDLLEYQKNPDKLIYICEGEKDVLNAVAYGINAITPGGASCLFEEKQLHFFEGLRIVILGDNDDSGEKFNERIQAQLKPVAKHTKKLNWLEFLKFKGEDFIPPKGFDLSDYLKMKNIKTKE
ncbi:hypothetical protein BKH42_08735 [Helicobacter sp. 13S00482-2]|uniref:toprim domain-containing protein n=1 Tax=Helicobacter sp. 13S00482-2 TaxID=1476200 RepID=UPI000BA7A294|nr:toprim domain-containing protein [Helicobacter sp. 13S00482-2]PAF52921.1 hypothetical protein BKH42_08735 [Helicobacter sp. 13S00482-2]